MASTVNKKKPINILSLNVRGLGKGAKRSSLFHWLKKHHDVHNKIMFLQETHVIKSQEYKWNETWHGKKIFANGTSRSKGVAILLPKSLDFKILSQTLDPNGRYIAIKIEIEGTIYGLINGYAPMADKLEEQMAWLEAIVGILEELGAILTMASLDSINLRGERNGRKVGMFLGGKKPAKSTKW